jgi:UDPglucose--hexose-1-phosphate uridylyltransferase
MLFTAPFESNGANERTHFHWHLEIVPRLTKQAGFEWGSGMYINPVPPESAAEFLRAVKV